MGKGSLAVLILLTEYIFDAVHGLAVWESNPHLGVHAWTPGLDTGPVWHEYMMTTMPREILPIIITS